MARTGEILRCPWHGWEFDIRTGRSVFNPHGVRAKIYPVGYQADALGPQSCVGAGPPEAVETYPVAVEARQVVVYL